MRYSVELTREAASYLQRLDKPTQGRVLARLRQLSIDPNVHSKPLAGTDVRASRVGGYRILFLRNA